MNYNEMLLFCLKRFGIIPKYDVNKDYYYFEHLYVYQTNEIVNNKIEFVTKKIKEIVKVSLSFNCVCNHLFFSLDAFERGFSYIVDNVSIDDLCNYIGDYLNLEKKPLQLSIFDL